MNNKQIILPIDAKPPMTVYRHYAFPLSVLSANGMVDDWILSHFINTYLMRDENGYIWFDFLEKSDFCYDRLSYIYLDYDNIIKYDIIEFIKSTLINNNYVALFLDEYYISSTINTNRIHSFEQVLIYGFDDEKKVFFSLGFDDRSIFGKMQYTYEEVLNGFNSIFEYNADELPTWVKWYTLTKVELKNADKQEDRLKEMILDILDYNNSTERFDKLRSETITERGKEAIYGIKCYEEIIKSLQLMSDSIIQTDYRHIHLLYEHKILMKDKLAYILKKLQIDKKNYIEQYDIVLKKIKLAKLLFLKSIISDKGANLYDCLKDKDTIFEIIQLLKDIYINEHDILERFLIETQKYLL